MRRGFTLLETVVSTALLALVAFFLLDVYPTSALAVRRGEQQIQADCLAQSVLDQARARNFDALAVGTHETFPLWVGESVSYRPTLEVFAVPATDETVMKGLRVTVQWQTQNRTRSVVHESWIHHVPR